MNYVMFPPYIFEVIDSFKKRNWLIHNYDLEVREEIYNPANYIINVEDEGVTYNLLLDLNIYQFLINSVKKEQPKEIYRDAVALLAFCQFSDIEIDPRYAVYEKMNYDQSNLDEALQELELFKQIDNADNEILARYALGCSDSIELNTLQKINREQTKQKLLKNRLNYWDYFYLTMLSMININIDESITPDKKLETFLNWLISDLIMSLVIAVYAIVFFGKKPIRGMMKFNKSRDPQERRKAVCNMTWDLYMMDQFFKKLKDKTPQEEFLFASDDKAFLELLSLAIKVQKKFNFEPLNPYLTDAGYAVVQDYFYNDGESEERVCKSQRWGAEYCEQLKLDFENKLYGIQ